MVVEAELVQHFAIDVLNKSLVVLKHENDLEPIAHGKEPHRDHLWPPEFRT